MADRRSLYEQLADPNSELRTNASEHGRAIRMLTAGVLQPLVNQAGQLKPRERMVLMHFLQENYCRKCGRFKHTGDCPS